MYANVVFVIRCLYSAVSLTLVKEYRFIRIIYYYVVFLRKVCAPHNVVVHFILFRVYHAQFVILH